MKTLIALAALVALTACAKTSEADRITSKPILDYCRMADTTASLVKHPNQSLMGGMREYRQEMEAKLRSQEDLCAMQKAGTLPAAGNPWPEVRWTK